MVLDGLHVYRISSYRACGHRSISMNLEYSCIHCDTQGGWGSVGEDVTGMGHTELSRFLETRLCVSFLTDPTK